MPIVSCAPVAAIQQGCKGCQLQECLPAAALECYDTGSINDFVRGLAAARLVLCSCTALQRHVLPASAWPVRNRLAACLPCRCKRYVCHASATTER